MTVKQSKQATKDQELTSIEEKLLKCAETKKPVLLYGKDAIGRKELVLKVHKEIGGIDRKYIDCGTKSGKEVYELLVGIAVYCTEPPDEDGGFNSGSCHEKDTNKGLLFECKGTLFVDSLHYDSKDEDNKYYRKLAEIIKKGINVNWLVAYTYDLESLPSYFREQFEVIGLEPENQVIPTAKGILKPEPELVVYNWSTNEDKQEVYCNGKLIAKLRNQPFKLFCCLYKKKGKFVDNRTLMNVGNYPVKEYNKSFVDMMNKLENTLKNGLDKQRLLAVKDKVLEKEKDKKRRNISYKLIT